MSDTMKTDDLTSAERAQIARQRAERDAAAKKLDPAFTRLAKVLLEAGVEVASATSKPTPRITVRCLAHHAAPVAGTIAGALRGLGLTLSPAGQPGPTLTSTVDYAADTVAELRLDGVDDAMAFPEPPKAEPDEEPQHGQ